MAAVELLLWIVQGLWELIVEGLCELVVSFLEERIAARPAWQKLALIPLVFVGTSLGAGLLFFVGAVIVAFVRAAMAL